MRPETLPPGLREMIGAAAQDGWWHPCASRAGRPCAENPTAKIANFLDAPLERLLEGAWPFPSGWTSPCGKVRQSGRIVSPSTAPACIGFPLARRAGATRQTPSRTSRVRSNAASRGSASFQTKPTITRPVSAILLERNGKWAVQRSHDMTPEPVAPVGMILSSACPSRRHDKPGQTRQSSRWPNVVGQMVLESTTRLACA